MNNTITPTQMGQLVHHAISTSSRQVDIYRGQPGIGKTQITKQVTAALNRDLIYIDLSQKDALDTLGLPTNQDGWTTFAKPQWLQRLNQPCVVFFDEIARSNPLVLSSILEFITERKVDALNFQVPDHVTILAACNRKSDKSDSRELAAHVKNRARIFDVAPDVDAAVQHLNKQGGDPLVGGFFRKRPSFLLDFNPQDDIHCTPRSMFALSADMPFIRKNPDLAYPVIRSHIGEGKATEFMGFMRLAHAIVDAQLIFDRPTTAPIPEEPSALYATLAGLAFTVTRKTADAFFQYLLRNDQDIAVAMVQDAMAREPDILSCKHGQKFAMSSLSLLRAS